MAVPSSVAAAAYEEMRKVVWAELDKYPHLKDLLKQFLEMEKARNVNFGGTRARHWLSRLVWRCSYLTCLTVLCTRCATASRAEV